MSRSPENRRCRTSTSRPEAAKTRFTSGSAKNAFFSEPTTPFTVVKSADVLGFQLDEEALGASGLARRALPPLQPTDCAAPTTTMPINRNP
jgi:hypothetical protein